MIKNLAIGGGSNRLLLVFALFLGLVAALLVGVYLSGAKDGGGGSSSGPAIPVVVASQDIPPLTVITPEMLTVKTIPSDVALPSVFEKTEDVVGQTTQVQLVIGEQILPTKVTSAASVLTTLGADAPLSQIIPQGKRAFAIYLSKVASVGGLARPGDRVDLILSSSGSGDESGLEAGSACYVMQDIEVLAIGQSLRLTATEGDANGIAAVGPNEEANTMTLAVSPQEAWQLAAYQKSVSDANVGEQLWVSLRPFGERGIAGDLPICTVVPTS